MKIFIIINQQKIQTEDNKVISKMFENEINRELKDIWLDKNHKD